uniref:Uncharacterized protein n=1 Tax=Panagrolaimus davidi TaxID=227884 RepID=A0A914PM11_9BILA
MNVLSSNLECIWLKTCPHINVKLYNDDVRDKKLLNNECGADYVQAIRLRPDGIDYQSVEPYTRFYHLDGDCDRMVMTFNDEDQHLHIFDGDHLLLFFISFIRKVCCLLCCWSKANRLCF